MLEGEATLDRYPLTTNDRDASKRVVDALQAHFGTERVRDMGPAPASEDFGSFGAEWHSASLVCWRHRSGCVCEGKGVESTLRTGVEAMTVATLVWLAR